MRAFNSIGEPAQAGHNASSGVVKRPLLVVLVGAAVLLGLILPGRARAAEPANGVCDWGGTAAAPTGYLTFSPGLTNTPSPGPVKFYATGPAVGAPCLSRVTFEGTLPPGETCSVVHFQQTVQGVPGVETAEGPGIGTVVHEILRNDKGSVVGFNDPSVENLPFLQALLADPTVCAHAPGFTHSAFYSTITLFGNGG